MVQLVDLAPTLYELAGVRPTGRPSGRSLAGLVGRAAPGGDGSAWAEGEAGERALYRREGGAFRSLLLVDPPVEAWNGRSLTFDAAAGELAFEARAFGVPRALRAAGPGGATHEQTIDTAWTRVRLALGKPGRVRLEVDGCGAPEGSSTRDAVCYGFQVRGVRPVRLELFDLAADPGQRHDLARREATATRSLARDLLAFRPQPRGSGAAAPVDAELAAQLQALGYAGHVEAARQAAAGQR